MPEDVTSELARCVRVIKESRVGLERLGVTGASITGSVARGESTKRSDVDVIVEFDPAIVTSIFDLSRIQGMLEGKLDRPVDVLSRRALGSSKHRNLIRDAVRVF